MAFTLADLPFSPGALADFSSEETFTYHHGKHHAGYVAKLNAAIDGTPYAGQTLEEIVRQSRDAGDKKVFNNAAQHVNHDFFWKCLSPDATSPSEGLVGQVQASFGSMETFRDLFSEQALTLFGSGWVWLVEEAGGALAIRSYKDAETPYASDVTPLLTLDVWEHAYYIDHRNDRARYVQAFWKHVNWAFVSDQLQK